MRIEDETNISHLNMLEIYFLPQIDDIKREK